MWLGNLRLRLAIVYGFLFWLEILINEIWAFETVDGGPHNLDLSLTFIIM